MRAFIMQLFAKINFPILLVLLLMCKQVAVHNDEFRLASSFPHDFKSSDDKFPNEFNIDAEEKMQNFKEYIHGSVGGNIMKSDGIKDTQKNTVTNNLSYSSSIETSVDTVNNTSQSIERDHKLTGGTLDEFATGKLGATDPANTLPIFLMEPENVFVVKNRPGTLKCKAAHALQLHFKCSGSSQPPPSTHDKHVDPHTGTHMEEVTATIHRDLVDEYFGKAPFKCECHAWSSRGVVKSQAASVNIAYIRKQFVTSPTSLRVELGTSAELKCEPPTGFPEPKITWLKNNVPLTESSDLNITPSKGTLIFRSITLQDMANYTCVAENIAGKRTSESAVIIVYVNGGWSPWGQWKECKCPGKLNQGRKRIRSCSNPIPLNGGTQCSGPQIQKSGDCISCVEDTQIVPNDGLDVMAKRNGRWTTWSEWSICSYDCIQVRRRKCIIQYSEESIAADGKLLCVGKDTQTAECRGGQCPLGNNDFEWTIYLVLSLVLVLFIAFGTILLFCARRGVRSNPHYNIASTVMETEYMHGVEKKEIAMHIEAVNAGYDYVNPSHGFFPSNPMMNCSATEHHYDVPNLTANYTNPIDNLSMDYLSDTAESSTGESSNSTFETKSKLQSSNLGRNTCFGLICNNGGILGIYNNEIMLYIPEMAIGKSVKKHISVSLLGDDHSRISSINTETSFVCSSVIQCAPKNFSFLKPVILKIPHCLCNPNDWNVSIYYADNEYDELNVNWRKIVTVGEETINTPMFVQIEKTHIYVMTEQLGRFVVIGNHQKQLQAFASVKMKLFAFNQIAPTNLNGSLRIYVVKDFPNSRDICSNIESKLGGSYMGESQTFAFHLNNCNLKIRIHCSSDDFKDSDCFPVYEQLIPYNHILSSNTILHCEFSIKRKAPNVMQSYNIEYQQVGDSSSPPNFFTVPSIENANSEISIEQETAVTVDRQGNFVNETIVKNSIKLPCTTKRMIMAALDPPRADEKDWRLLARKLNSDRYIAYFATKPSPTEQILNLWECRALKSNNTVAELLLTLREMDRQDVLDIIMKTMGPLWI